MDLQGLFLTLGQLGLGCSSSSFYNGVLLCSSSEGLVMGFLVVGCLMLFRVAEGFLMLFGVVRGRHGD